MRFPEEQQSLSLQRILNPVWQTDIRSVALLGHGVYGTVYGVTFGRFPYRAVVKLYKHNSIGEQERRQLNELRTYFPILVPHVYAYIPATDLGDALVMEWLHGQSYSRPEQLPHAVRASLQHQVVKLLLQLHSIEHEEGYGEFDGPFYLHWWDYYGRRVQDTYQAIISNEESRTYLGSQVLALMEYALERGEQILNTSAGRPVLLHGDFCFNNLLFDANTKQVSGLFDPMDAEWGERELDLVNLINGHIHHFELLNRYREVVQLDDCFPLRYWFYQVWKWLFYYVRVKTPCREWVLRCGHELEKAMTRL